MWTIDSFKDMEPEKYYDNPCPDTLSLKQKREDIINNKDDLYVATEKHDGCWSMLIHKSKGDNLIRSRSISKVTNAYGDFTKHLPHIVEEMDKLPDNTCLIGEICWNVRGKTSNDVDVILHCLPDKAIKRQEEMGKLHVVVFDCLMNNGVSFEDCGYLSRRLSCGLSLLDDLNLNYIHTTQLFLNNFKEEAMKIWEDGGEGIVIQRKDGLYTPGKRVAWKTLKYKQTLDSMELLVIDTIEPNMRYEGKDLDNWHYWYQNIPLTKPYFYRWKNGVVVDYNGICCEITSGLSDIDREWLATNEAQELIKNKQLYAEVKAMMVNSKDSLRHPSLIRLRSDKV